MKEKSNISPKYQRSGINHMAYFQSASQHKPSLLVLLGKPLNPKNSTQDIREVALFSTLTLIFSILLQMPRWDIIYENIYNYPMIDRWVYQSTLLTGNLTIDYIDEFTPIMYFTYEWTWQSSLAFLNRNLGFPPDEIFASITTIIIWRFAYEAWRSSGWSGVILLINPLFIDLAYSQMRVAIAVTILSFVWRGQRGIIFTGLLYVLAASVHTATILFALAHIASHIFRSHQWTSLIGLCGTGVIISLLTGPLRQTILLQMNDRRVDYEIMASSLSYLSFWLVYLVIIIIASRTEKNTTLDTRYSMIISAIVFTNLLTSGYSTRFLAVSLPQFIASFYALGDRWKIMTLCVFIPYVVLQWLYWFRLL